MEKPVSMPMLSEDLQASLCDRLDRASAELRAIATEACRLRPDGRVRKPGAESAISYAAGLIEDAIVDDRDARFDRETKIEKVQKNADQVLAMINEVKRDESQARRARKDLELDRLASELAEVEEGATAELARIQARL